MTKNQINSFENHIEACIETNLPLIVHSRNAENDTFNILNKYKQKFKNIDALFYWFI